MTELPVGRLILPALRWAEGTGFGHEEPTIAAALDAGAGGFIIFGGPSDDVRALTASLGARAGRPLLIGADLERGAGQQFAGLTELPPPLALAALADLGAVRYAGALTAREALSVGVNWVFAPVADLDVLPDNPIVQTRSFGSDPAAVAACVRTWIDGCQATGAAACVKHFPGHGRTSSDSHAGLPVVETGAQTLRSSDALPFEAAIGAGVAGVMTAHVAYPALDPSGRPATLSAAVTGTLREDYGFEGVIVTDALIMEGAFVGRTENEAYVDAIAAGVDLLLYPKSIAAAAAALGGALDEGTLAPVRVAEALRRYHALLARVSRAAPNAASGGHEDLPARLVERGLFRGDPPLLFEPLELVVVDDDIGGPYPASPSDWTRQALRSAGIRLGSGGSRIVLAFAEPRAWKGRGGFGEATRAQLRVEAPTAELIVLFAHPRLTEDVPGAAPLLLAWHRQRPMQEAAASWIAAHVSR